LNKTLNGNYANLTALLNNDKLIKELWDAKPVQKMRWKDFEKNDISEKQIAHHYSE
jgi:hypothetical protein